MIEVYNSDVAAWHCPKCLNAFVLFVRRIDDMEIGEIVCKQCDYATSRIGKLQRFQSRLTEIRDASYDLGVSDGYHEGYNQGLEDQMLVDLNDGEGDETGLY